MTECYPQEQPETSMVEKKVKANRCDTFFYKELKDGMMFDELVGRTRGGARGKRKLSTTKLKHDDDGVEIVEVRFEEDLELPLQVEFILPETTKAVREKSERNAEEAVAVSAHEIPEAEPEFSETGYRNVNNTAEDQIVVVSANEHQEVDRDISVSEHQNDEASGFDAAAEERGVVELDSYNDNEFTGENSQQSNINDIQGIPSTDSDECSSDDEDREVATALNRNSRLSDDAREITNGNERLEDDRREVLERSEDDESRETRFDESGDSAAERDETVDYVTHTRLTHGGGGVEPHQVSTWWRQRAYWATVIQPLALYPVLISDDGSCYDDEEAVMDSPSDEILRDEETFILNISQFYNQQALSDVLLKIGDQKFYGHKFVLAKSSDVFRTMLYERPWSQGVTEDVELNESPECQAVFDKFLRYLYTAEIMIAAESAVGILCLADKYNVASLKELCVKYMINHSKSPRVNNALAWYPWSKALHLKGLMQQCIQTICWNTTDIITSQEWTNMDVEFVQDILHSSELVVTDEYALFEAITTWLLHPSHVNSLGEYSTRLLPLIRFPQLMVSQLYQIEHSDVASHVECGDLIRQLIGRAYRFRAICPTQGDLSVSFAEAFFLPRDYTHLTVDTVRMSNTVRFQVDVKMYIGPVPKEVRDGDWRVTYRRQLDNWSLQIYCHETAMVQTEAKFQAVVLIYNEDDKVIQVERAPVFRCCRSSHQTMTFTIQNSEQAKVLGLLIKPLPD
ncbi:uncharacterized protein LOC141905067 [Tubulanus polymorphus]|uniref:uncharacterized protein LOC141905067 n=1 Tax=Tubulanus polymorphus TaxID=672921 RepID=UPI003DA69813